MRITRLEAENFKRIKAVAIDPDPTTVVIAGRNAQGKSSVLDSIMAALAGRAGSKEITRPIRDGEQKARVAVELDDLVVERRWTMSGTTLAVTPKGSNARLNSPQAVLDRLIGSLSFDPLAFAEAEPKKQVETLIDLIGREEFEAVAAERKAAYEERTDVNREVKRFKAEVDNRADAEPTEPVDTADLLERLSEARLKGDLRAEWEAAQAEIERLQARQAEIIERVSKIFENETVETLTDLLNRAGEINKAAQRWTDREAAMSELAGAQTRSERLTEEIQRCDDKRARLVREANLPVDGLTFDEDQVLYNGVPFTQSSAAERLKVSVAMAMALNPELRVICIRDASLLDADSKRALVALAEEHDYQIWYEVVGDGGEVGVIIEDGEVQA